MKLLAHTYDNKIQLLSEHLKNVSDLSCVFAENCGLNTDHMRQIALYHDVGKSSDEFQQYLLGKSGRVSHSLLGGGLLFNADKIGSLCVFGHHTGLPDYGTQNDKSTTFLGRYNASKTDNLHYHMSDIPLPEIKPFGNAKIREENKQNKSLYYFDASLEIRMFLSCLVDADWQDSTASIEKMDTDSWDVIYRRFFERTDILFRTSAEAPLSPKQQQINEWRTSIFNDCRSAGRTGKQKVVSLSAPTGAGKTLASMAFALERVRRGDASRIIYCIPYTSIIEQNAGVYESMIGSCNVVENHSLAEHSDKNITVSEEAYRSWMVENWDAPVVLTTNVQFFESLLSHSPKRVRKLHNIANSIIILDEAQMLPLEFLTPCKELLKLLADQYNCTIVLCTATQPVLHIGEDGNEILSDAGQMYERFKRVSAVNIPDVLSYEQLTDAICKDTEFGNSVLCVMNRRNDARDVFKLLQKKSHIRVYHLSLNMCAKHREQVLSEIRERMKTEVICVVSTSLIEAGVDISFDTGYRELAGLDRLVQVAGRVNRNGKRDIGVLKVFCLNTMKYNRMEEREANRLLRSGTDVFSQEAVRKYFNAVYSYLSDESFDTHEILKRSRQLSFREIGGIHFIENGDISVIIPFDETAERLIKELEEDTITKKDFRKLCKYTVNISSRRIKELVKHDAVEQTPNGIYILKSLVGWYDADYGLE